MSPNDLVRTLRDQPFEPFRIVMSNGSTHDVMHPELLMVSVRSSFLFTPSATRPGLVDHYIKLDNLHIIKLVPLDSVAAT
jgi:hypothetical protein